MMPLGDKLDVYTFDPHWNGADLCCVGVPSPQQPWCWWLQCGQWRCAVGQGDTVCVFFSLVYLITFFNLCADIFIYLLFFLVRLWQLLSVWDGPNIPARWFFIMKVRWLKSQTIGGKMLTLWLDFLLVIEWYFSVSSSNKDKVCAVMD